MKDSYRVGQGYDAHRLAPDRELIVGGVRIPFEKGLLGHSDADVLVHAVIDSLLGAAGLGDIGRHFPDTDKKWKDADSIRLLEAVAAKVRGNNWEINNVDGTIVAQKPKFAPYIDDMRKNIARAMNIAPEAVNVKAKTTEGMGFAGREEGIEAHAVVSIRKGDK